MFVRNFVKNQRILKQISPHFTVRFSDKRYTWWYELHPPHLINVATLPCESRNSKNVILQWHITKENCIKRVVYASSNWTCIWHNLGCSAAMRVWNKGLWHLWPAKTLDANLGWFWKERHRGCDWPLARPSEIMCACWWRKLWTMNTCCEIVVHLYYVVYQNILWNCQCNLVHLRAIS